MNIEVENLEKNKKRKEHLSHGEIDDSELSRLKTPWGKLKISKLIKREMNYILSVIKKLLSHGGHTS